MMKAASQTALLLLLTCLAVAGVQGDWLVTAFIRLTHCIDKRALMCVCVCVFS